MNGGTCAPQSSSKGGLRAGYAFTVDVLDDHPLDRRQADGQLLSHALFAHHFAAQHFDLARPTSEVTGASVHGHHGDRTASLEHIQVVAKGAVGGVHHRLQFTVAESRSSFECG